MNVHIPEVLSGRCRSPDGVFQPQPVVKGPGCERRMPRPERAALRRDTSPSSATCGSETGPHYVGRRELHPGKSTGLEEERHGDKSLRDAVIRKVSWFLPAIKQTYRNPRRVHL